MASFLNEIGDSFVGDTRVHFSPDSLIGQSLYMLSGANVGKYFKILHNTADSRFYLRRIYPGFSNGDFETGSAAPFYFNVQEPQWGGFGKVSPDFAHEGNYGAGLYNSPYRTCYLLIDIDVTGLTSVGWWCKRMSGGTPFMQRSLFNIGVGIVDAAHYDTPLWDIYYPLQTLGVWEYRSMDVSGWGLSGIQSLQWYLGYAGGPGTAYKLMYFDDIVVEGSQSQTMFEMGFNIGDYYRIYNPLEGPLRIKPSWSIQIGAL
jgi:hypothetical protein